MLIILQINVYGKSKLMPFCLSVSMSSALGKASRRIRSFTICHKYSTGVVGAILICGAAVIICVSNLRNHRD